MILIDAGSGTSPLGNRSFRVPSLRQLIHKIVTNRQHVGRRQGESAFAKQDLQGAGSPFAGPCMARLKIGKRLLSVCAFLCISAPELRAAVTAPGPAAASFAYAQPSGDSAAVVGDRAHDQ